MVFYGILRYFMEFYVWEKNSGILWNFITGTMERNNYVFGLLYRPPFTDEGQIWCAIADPWYTLMCQISSRSVYSGALWRQKKTIFAIFCHILDFGI